MLERLRKLSSSIGPGLITAALVLGPGSVTTVSKAGASAGYRLMWATVLAGVLMAAYTAMSARIGAVTSEPLLTLVARLYGRWLAVVMGVLSFVVCSCFQAGDNLGVSIAMQAVLADALPGVSPATVVKVSSLAFTAVAMALVLASSTLYKTLERLMTVLVLVMMVCFFANLIPARPSVAGVARGLVPSAKAGDLPLIVPIVATTFSVIAALYQSYIVQGKGWKMEDYRKGIWDSLAGIAVLTLLSAVIMVTAAAVLQPRGVEVKTAGDLAIQLEPLLGPTAKHLFCAGLWAASFSSLVANAIVGGGLLADGLGRGGSIEKRSVKVLTVAVMLVGAVVAHFGAGLMLNLIVLAQALTILFVPICAAVLLLMANSRAVMGERVNGWCSNALGAAGLLAVTGLGIYQFVQLLPKLGVAG